MESPSTIRPDQRRSIIHDTEFLLPLPLLRRTKETFYFTSSLSFSLSLSLSLSHVRALYTRSIANRRRAKARLKLTFFESDRESLMQNRGVVAQLREISRILYFRRSATFAGLFLAVCFLCDSDVLSLGVKTGR